MSIIYSVFLNFLLCLSMHACVARHMWLDHKGFDAPLHHSGKGVLLVVEKFSLGMDSTKGSVKKEDATAEKGHGGAIIEDTEDSMTSTDIKGLKYARGFQKSGMGYAGSEVLESSGHMGLLKAASTNTKKDDPRRRALSAKEAVDSSTDKVEDNVVFTDYNPPHQTPPINN